METMINNLFAEFRIRVIVAGTRGYDNYTVFERTVHTLLSKWSPADIQLVSGMAKSGADFLVQRYNEENMPNPLAKFPANWDAFKKRAGFIRNEEMAKYATHLIAFWDGKSSGTKHMIDLAHKYGLKVKVILIEIPTDAV